MLKKKVKVIICNTYNKISFDMINISNGLKCIKYKWSVEEIGIFKETKNLVW